MTGNDFPDLLEAYRVSRGVTQGKLARLAGFDHSTVSRFESGDRHPSRDTVLRLARALGLGRQDTDTLLAAAGYLPTDPASLLGAEPELGRVYAALASDAVPREIKALIRRQVAALADTTEVWT